MNLPNVVWIFYDIHNHKTSKQVSFEVTMGEFPPFPPPWSPCLIFTNQWEAPKGATKVKMHKLANNREDIWCLAKGTCICSSYSRTRSFWHHHCPPLLQSMCKTAVAPTASTTHYIWSPKLAFGNYHRTSGRWILPLSWAFSRICAVGNWP